MNVGDYLYASCSAVLFGRIKAIDWDHMRCTVLLFDVTELDEDTREWDHLDGEKWVDTEAREPDRGELVRHVLPEENPITVRFTVNEHGWSDAYVDRRGSWTGEFIVLDTPGDGCFRCTKSFMGLDKINPEWEWFSIPGRDQHENERAAQKLFEEDRAQCP